MHVISSARDSAGLLTRQHLLDGGASPRVVRDATRVGGPLVVVRRGVYVDRHRWEVSDGTARMLLRDRAVHLTVRQPHRMSHDSAARAHGLSLLRGLPDLSHLTRSGVRGARTEHGVKHHLAHGELTPDEVAGLPVTGLARTALDLGREHGARQGAVAVTEVLRRGVPRAELERVLSSMWCWPGSTQARAALALADPGCESVGEVLALELVAGLGLGAPITQLAVRLADGRLVWCDLCVGCHVIEFDGKVKYHRRDDGGVAERSASEVAWAERQRERAVLAEGLGMSRLVWADYWGAARLAAEERLRREILETHARLGQQLPPHLLELNARVRPRRVPWR